MANRITPEQIEQINEVYCACGNKSLTAKTIGVSVASVTKYLIKEYVPRALRSEAVFDEEIPGGKTLIDQLTSCDNVGELLSTVYCLTEQEKAELHELQKEIF